MISNRFIFALVSVTLCACTTTGSETSVEIGNGLINADTQVLDQKYVDQSFSLPDVYEELLRESIANSDRRAINGAVDRTLSSAPDSAPALWNNPVTSHEGQANLVLWNFDKRVGELCGTLKHRAELPDLISGAVVVCRSATDSGWKIDEVAWVDRPHSATKNSSGRSVKNTTVDVPPPRIPTVQSPPSNAGVRRPNYTPSPCPDGTGSGSQTLGDCLAAPN